MDAPHDEVSWKETSMVRGQDDGKKGVRQLDVARWLRPQDDRLTPMADLVGFESYRK